VIDVVVGIVRAGVAVVRDTVAVAVRPAAAEATAAWDAVIATHHPLVEEAPLHAGGSPTEVAAALRPWLAAGVDEIVESAELTTYELAAEIS